MSEEKSFFSRLRDGLKKTRDNVTKGLQSAFMGVSEVDESFYEEVEEILYMGDLGARTTEEVLTDLRTEITERNLVHPSDLRRCIKEILRQKMLDHSHDFDFENFPTVLTFIGVNGVGKTTSMGKIGSRYKAQGKRILFAACDTFRAAATEQLQVWAERANVPMVALTEGADPSAVLFDAIRSAKSKKIDFLFCDTAGRLHNKKNLMDELHKMSRVIEKEAPEYRRENLLVLDATTGQNAIFQAREFMSVMDITGIVLTKMDGTAKGGVAIAIENELKLPVKFIGVGETLEDLQKFDPDDFIEVLFSEE